MEEEKATPPPTSKPTKMEEEKKPLTEAERAKAKGNDEFQKKNFEAALTHYNKAIELDPKELIFYSNKAAALIELKKYDDAIAAIDDAFKASEEHHIKDYGKFAKLYHKKANAFTHKEDYPTALALLDKSLLEDSNWKVKDERKRVEKLQKDLEAASYFDPALGDKAREEGNELYKGGKFPEAIKRYEEATKRNPKDARSYSNHGICLSKLGDLPGALKMLEKAVELDPKFVKAWIKKGSVHFTMKDFHKALQCYEAGLKTEPENEECKTGIAQTQAAIMGGAGGADEDQQARAQRGMSDPEVQGILREPEIVNLLKDLSERPNSAEAQKALQNPAIVKKIEKLVAAGILKIG